MGEERLLSCHSCEEIFLNVVLSVLRGNENLFPMMSLSSRGIFMSLVYQSVAFLIHRLLRLTKYLLLHTHKISSHVRGSMPSNFFHKFLVALFRVLFVLLSTFGCFLGDDMIRMTMEGILLPYPLDRLLSSSMLARSHQKNLLPDDIWGWHSTQLLSCDIFALLQATLNTLRSPLLQFDASLGECNVKFYHSWGGGGKDRWNCWKISVLQFMYVILTLISIRYRSGRVSPLRFLDLMLSKTPFCVSLYIHKLTAHNGILIGLMWKRQVTCWCFYRCFAAGGGQLLCKHSLHLSLLPLGWDNLLGLLS